MDLTLTIPGEPIAQPRAKATTIGGFARMYTPTKTSTGRTNGIAEYKAAVRLVAAKSYSGPPLDCPVEVDCEWVFGRSKGMIWKKKPMVRMPHTAPPDRDNLDKATLDALKSVILRDDSLVYTGRLLKVYAAGDEQPHTTIRIRTVEEGT